MDPYGDLTYVATWDELGIYDGGTDPVYMISYWPVGNYEYAINGPAGGGLFYWVGTPSPPLANFTDFGTIQPSTTMSGYWQRVTAGQMATPEWFGAYGDGIQDDTGAFNGKIPVGFTTVTGGCIKWASQSVNNLISNTKPTVGSPTCVLVPTGTGSAPAYGEIWVGPPIIYLSQKYAISQPIVLPSGIHLTFLGGTIIATPTSDYPGPLDYILRTNFTTDGTFFSNRDIQIDGKGYLDGNCVANQSMAYTGLWTDNLTASKISGLTIVNCLRTKWNNESAGILSFTTVSDGTITSTVLTMSSIPSGIAINDIVRIYNSYAVPPFGIGPYTGAYGRSAYSVVKFDLTAVTITLDQIVSDDYLIPIRDPSTSGETLFLDFFPTGFLINGHENVIRDCRAVNNGVGFAFGNSFFAEQEGILGNDDNIHEYLVSENNYVAAVYLTSASCINVKSTFQHSVFENLITGNGASNLQFRLLYSEAGGNFSSIGLETYPLNYIGGSSIDINCECPIDSTSVGWFRPFQVDAVDTRLKLYGTNGGVLSTHPPHTGDVSVVMLTNAVNTHSNLKLTIAGYNQFNVQSTLQLAVVDNNYAFPNTRCFIESTDINNGNLITAGIINLKERIVNVVDSVPVINVQGSDLTQFRWTLLGGPPPIGDFVPPPTVPVGDLIVDGKVILFRFVQDSVGSRTVTWPASYYFSPKCPMPVLQSAPNAIDYVQFVYNANAVRWECITEAVTLDRNLTKSASYTILMSDFINNNTNTLTIFASGTTTITLPAAGLYAGYTINIIKTDSSASVLTVKGSGGTELINGATTYTGLTAQYSAAIIKSNGTQSFVV